ncbi:MAG: hypothetical protein NTZ10_06140 [Candidatus Saganbacteria bacterium]|nr:hypothetical protein [Candidatus Saganbacteria bacterium]
MAREAFFRVIMPDPFYLMNTGTKLITKRAAVEYKHEVYLYDDIEIGIKVGAVKPASSELIFNYRRKKDNLLFALGYQAILFADKNGEPIKIPKEIVEKARPYTDEVKYVLGKIFK